VLFISLLLAASHAQALDLVSAEEAARPADDSVRAITRPPTIVYEQPSAKGDPMRSPFRLKIAFKPRGGTRIDVKSVQLTYMKLPMLDLTERLRTGISESGILMDNVSLPSGLHKIQVRVTDSEGRESVSLLELNVVP